MQKRHPENAAECRMATGLLQTGMMLPVCDASIFG
jgi:hypothetical protein